MGVGASALSGGEEWTGVGPQDDLGALPILSFVDGWVLGGGGGKRSRMLAIGRRDAFELALQC